MSTAGRPRSGHGPRHRLDLRGRITLLVALAVAAAVALTSAAAFVTASRELTRQLNDSLLDRARTAAAGVLGQPEVIRQADVSLLGVGDISLALVSANRTAIVPTGAGTPPLAGPELAVARGERGQEVRSSGHERVAAVSVSPGVALVVAQSTRPSERTLRTLGIVLLGVGLVGVALASVVGLAVARASLRPVEDLTAAAERVAQTSRLDPIEVHGEDELGRLAVSFNAMLDALARSRVRERQLVADAGHELRTPLTSLRTNLDLLVQSDAAQPGAQLAGTDRAELLDDVRAQLTELSGLVDDLVELSREGMPAAHAVDLDLAEVVAHGVDRVRLRSPGVRWDVATEPWEVRGDEALLERAVTNLLDNAVKWSPAGGQVTVRLRDGVLGVADDGPGIDPTDVPHVFDRFYRSTAARALPGSGLGLSIVARAAQQHGGAVEVRRSPSGGALLMLRLPGRRAVAS